MRASVRIGVIWHLPQYLAEKGIDVAKVLSAAGVGANVFDSPDYMITYLELERLLLECERRTGSDDVVLEVGRATRLRNFGLAGDLALCAATAGEGLRQFAEYFNLHSTATVISVHDQGEYVRLIYAITTLGLSDTRHLQTGGAVVSVNILRDLCGPRWRPLSVDVACRAPGSYKAFERFFDAKTRFHASTTSVCFERRWLDSPLPVIEEQRRLSLLSAARARLDAMRQDWPDTVRRLARQQMLLGPFSMDDTARLLGVHRRTLDRRLKQHGVQYGSLVEATRHEAASQLLRETDLPVQRIAEVMHYSSPANFATAFRRIEGITPTGYRQQHPPA